MKFIKRFVKDWITKAIPDKYLINKLGRSFANSILLTFDDGPDETFTPLILDILDKFHARAVFFVVGRNAEKYHEIITAIHNKGHLIGNHTYSHNNKKILMNEYINELNKCQEILNNIIGKYPVLFRPPRGIVTPTSLFETACLKLQTVLWSVEGGEWGRCSGLDPIQISKRLLKKIRSRDIVLLHDDNPKTPEMLDIILRSDEIRRFDLFDGIECFMNYKDSIKGHG